MLIGGSVRCPLCPSSHPPLEAATLPFQPPTQVSRRCDTIPPQGTTTGPGAIPKPYPPCHPSLPPWSPSAAVGVASAPPGCADVLPTAAAAARAARVPDAITTAPPGGRSPLLPPGRGPRVAAEGAIPKTVRLSARPDPSRSSPTPGLLAARPTEAVMRTGRGPLNC